jgi:cyclopropane fatty-acyl-phospholipid synthase-like methyltransferase
MLLRSIIVEQFKKPRGLLGRLAGFIMAIRPSNRQRNEWTISLLELEPNHKVLEIGCGPGFALKVCTAKLSEGHIVGIDHSEVMVSQAQHRLAAEIKAGRTEVRLSSLFDLEVERNVYDRIFSSNVIQFLPDIDAGFRKIYDCLIDHGVVATTYQPRSKKPTRKNALEMAARIKTAMKAAGFKQIELYELPLKPVTVICVTGIKV